MGFQSGSIFCLLGNFFCPSSTEVMPYGKRNAMPVFNKACVCGRLRCGFGCLLIPFVPLGACRPEYGGVLGQLKIFIIRIRTLFLSEEYPDR